MKIKVNNKPQELEKELSISELLIRNSVEMPEMVSVQLNGEFVNKKDFEKTTVRENDAIDFLYFMGGGGFTTKALHTRSLKKDPHGALNFPVYDSAAFEFDSAEEIEKAFLGQKPAHMYSRITNPTVEDFEQKIKAVTGSFGVAALSSGMAAISNLIMTLAGQGDNVVTTNHLFGNTYSLFERTFKPWGLEVRYADLTDMNKVKAAVDEKTRAIFLETITNPQLEVADVQAISRISREKKTALIADTTITPLYFMDAKKMGIDVEVLSSTKYLSGGATSVGGLIIDYGSYDWQNNPHLKESAKKYGPSALLTKLKRQVYRDLGACLSPHNAYLQSLGLATFALRAEKSCANSLLLAEFLSQQSHVKKVNYPGLKSSPFYGVAQKQFGDKCGALVTFDLASKEECFNFLNRLKLIRRATNLNDNKTLALHPASTIYCEFSPELRKEMGIGEAMIRLAVGIEEAEDLTGDIKQALGG